MKLPAIILLILFALPSFAQDVIKLSTGKTLNRNIIYVDDDIIITENFKGKRDTIQLSDVTRYRIDDNEKAKFFKEILVPSIYYKSGNLTPGTSYQSSVSPGDYLIKAKSRMAGGVGMSLVGSILMGISPVVTDDQTTQYVLLGVGGGFSIAGIGVFISGITQIGKAGQRMNQLNIGKSATLGIGIQDHGIGLNVKL